MAALSPRLILQRTDYWLNVAIFQGARLSTLLGQQSDGDPATWSDERRRIFREANQLGRDHIVEEAESYFFVVAVRNALRWLDRAKAVAPAVAGAVDTFLPAAEHIADVRDMHEHEEEYLAGKGRNKDRYRHEGGVWKGTPGPSAHSIVVSGVDYWIGGRVNLAPTLAALRTLQPAIERARGTVKDDES